VNGAAYSGTGQCMEQGVPAHRRIFADPDREQVPRVLRPARRGGREIDRKAAQGCIIALRDSLAGQTKLLGAPQLHRAAAISVRLYLKPGARMS
jgi:hypothetical protein